MKEPDSGNTEQLDRRSSDAIDHGIQLGKAILGVEMATARALHQARHYLSETKDRLMQRSRKAGQG